MDPKEQFKKERISDINEMSLDKTLYEKSIEWMIIADKYKYTYNYSWMGRPIIKFPNDIVIQQEIMWDIKPDLIIETGIAHGGSIILSASLQQMMNIEKAEVIGIDIEIREHNRKEIENHPMYEFITMYEGDSTSNEILEKVKKHVTNKKTVMLILDSNHTHDHVLKELELYSQFITVNSYILLPDTFIEYFPKGYYSQTRPWDVGNNPMTAIKEFLKYNDNFIIDKNRVNKLQITEMFDGILKKVK